MLKEVVHIITIMFKELRCLTEDTAALVCRTYSRHAGNMRGLAKSVLYLMKPVVD